jgi:ATP-dependent Clp protease ATP-binding subunit ClpC
MISHKDIVKSGLYPVVVLDRFFSHRMRHRIEAVLASCIAIAIVSIIAEVVIRKFGLLSGDVLSTTQVILPRVMGFALIALALWIVVFLLEAFFRSFYFQEGEEGELKADTEADLVSFQVLRILAGAKEGDITKAFFRSETGRYVLLRLGIDDQDQGHFLEMRGSAQGVYEIEVPPLEQNEWFTLSKFTRFLIEHDTAFKEFLFAHGAKEEDLTGAAMWVAHESEYAKRYERWWSREHLAEIPGLGKDWSYGHAYALERYANEIRGSEYAEAHHMRLIKRGKETNELERILLRAKEANAVLVGDPGVGKTEVIGILAHRIQEHHVHPALEHKHILSLDTGLLLAHTGDKTSFEREMINILQSALHAGNIVLVIKDFPQFILNARSVGSNVVELLDPYLDSPEIQFVVTSDIDAFHQLVEPDALLMKRFEKIIIEETDQESTLGMLERTARSFEAREPIFFTYPALREVLHVADRYVTDGVMPDKAINFLIELVPHVIGKKKRFVMKTDVDELVRMKTNIPVGEINDTERTQLTQLETFLHKRVIGQDQAVRAIASAMRRSRAGIRNLNRPIGSFLFLGPTGVGKTETTKALAEAMFGDEHRMVRFDMSEYQSPDALARLIGSVETNTHGTLAKALREQPYCVLLLDEFEKTNIDVHDLFLQILDEGIFTDAFGKKVNARNTIIIATSNAGSDLIWEMVRRGENPTEQKDSFIEELVKEGAFKPELLNRFDGVIVFHPLSEDHVEKVARLMLEGLANRLRARNVDLVVTDDLVKQIARQGYNQSFGARPINRFIQERLEQVIAEKMISGEIHEGMRIAFSDSLIPHSA